MTDSRLFNRCLCFSLIAHTCLLFTLPYRVLNYKPSNEPIEVAYLQSWGEEKEAEISPKPVLRPSLTTEKTLKERKELIGDFLKKEIFSPKKETVLNKVNAVQTSKKRSVQTPSIPGEAYQTPEYKNYYHIVREKIRRHAYRNYQRLQEGEVYLTFVLSPSGQLLESRINESQSSSDEYLRKITLESVHDSAPFPEFPPKLKYKDSLSFNVIISFELK